MAAGLKDNGGIDAKEVVSDILSEFLEVAFHYILYIREVYPQAFFEKRRKYNIPVWMCIHPELNQYIKDVLVGARTLMRSGDVDKVVLAITNKDHQLVEKFTFQMSGLSEDALREDCHLLQLETDLRSVITKLGVCDAELKPNPPDCTFKVYIHTSRVAAATMDHQQEFAWVSADMEAPPTTNLVPVKSISSSLVQMGVLVEEFPSKQTLKANLSLQ